MKANKRNRSENEGKTNSAGSTGGPRAGPGAFCRGSSSVVGTKAGSNEGGRFRQGWWGLSHVRRGCTGQPRLQSGAAVRGGMTAGSGHLSRSGAASWSASVLGSWGWMTGVEAGAGSASWLVLELERRKGHPCACISMCPLKKEHSQRRRPALGRPPRRQSSTQVV